MAPAKESTGGCAERGIRDALIRGIKGEVPRGPESAFLGVGAPLVLFRPSRAWIGLLGALELILWEPLRLI